MENSRVVQNAVLAGVEFEATPDGIVATFTASDEVAVIRSKPMATKELAATALVVETNTLRAELTDLLEVMGRE